MAPLGGAYFRLVDTSVPPNPPTFPSLEVGIESEFVVKSDNPINFVSGDEITINATVLDVADQSNVSGVTVQYIWDFKSNQSIGTALTDAEGNASFTWTTSNIAPGDYILQLLVADDLTDPLADGNSRRTGNVLSSMLLFKFRPTFESITCLQPSLLEFHSHSKDKSLTMMTTLVRSFRSSA